MLANQSNKDLVDNLLPIWTGRELDKQEIIEILEESEGDNDKGRIFILNTNIHLGYGFPCKPATLMNQRLNDVRNNTKLRQKPVLKTRKPAAQ